MPHQALILVVDDDEAGRFSKVQRLRRAGYRIVEAATGSQTLEIAERDSPDLVLLDVNLPDIGGFEVCRRLKALQVTPAMQVLHLSSTSVSDEDRVRGLAGGADAYLTEPIHSDVLIATIGALLRVRRAEQAMSEAMRKEQEARRVAEEANRFKDDFLAALSHELRTPLSAMVGWIWQLRQGAADETFRRRALDALERSTTLQVRLINDLLDVSRIGKGKLELEFAEVLLSEIVELAVESVQGPIKARKLKLTVSIEPVRLMGDAARLQQIVANLLTNAVQFSHEAGHIDVDLSTEGPNAIIRVRDDGEGIAPDLLPHVFDQFRQGDYGFARRHGGLGLGLSIVRQLVALHGGTVHATSGGIGGGATFVVRLPIVAAPTVSTAAADTTHAVALDGARVLVVDDDGDSRMWLSAVIRSAHGQVTAVESAERALEQLSAAMFDLVVSDIGMPKADGLTLIKMLREAGHTMPAAAVTAFSAPEEIQRILTAGYQAYFSKPIQPESFLERLSALLGSTSRSHDR